MWVKMIMRHQARGRRFESRDGRKNAKCWTPRVLGEDFFNFVCPFYLWQISHYAHFFRAYKSLYNFGIYLYLFNLSYTELDFRLNLPPTTTASQYHYKNADLHPLLWTKHRKMCEPNSNEVNGVYSHNSSINCDVV